MAKIDEHISVQDQLITRLQQSDNSKQNCEIVNIHFGLTNYFEIEQAHKILKVIQEI